MSDAFQASRAMAAAAARQDYGIAVILPDLPLWVPEKAKAAIASLMLSTTRLALQDAAGYISDEAGKFADTGNLAQSFGSDPATADGGIELLGRDATTGINGRVFSSLPYAIVMNDGRRAGAPINREGIDAIGLWAQRKLGLTAKQADHAKYAIAANLVAHGFPGYDYFEHGVNKARPRVEALFKILADQIGVQLTQEHGGASGTGAA